MAAEGSASFGLAKESPSGGGRPCGLTPIPRESVEIKRASQAPQGGLRIVRRRGNGNRADQRIEQAACAAPHLANVKRLDLPSCFGPLPTGALW